jgi:hypothetical protein
MPLELRFAETQADLIAAVRLAVANGARTIRIEPWTAAEAFMVVLKPELDAEVDFVTTGDVPKDLPKGLTIVEQDAPVDVVAVADWESEAVAAALMGCLDLDAGLVIAPVTENHFSERPLFLISIPKAGTHLLLRLAEAIGYPFGGISASDPPPGRWYTIEQETTHTKASDMFEKILMQRRVILDPPFLRAPALFIYRDPRDVAVSTANYNHRPEVFPFHGYFANLSFRERLARCVDDTWLLGSIRDQMVSFAAWLDMPNVIPISFEELVGASGGGDDNVQRKLVWSILLKLQAPGRPEVIAGNLFDRSSPTFHTGQIGAWRQHFDRDIHRLFSRQKQDFMHRYGYDPKGRKSPLPAHREIYRRRKLHIVNSGFEKLPILIESDIAGCNIVRYRRRYFALPLTLGQVELGTWSETALETLTSDAELPALRAKLQPAPDADGVIGAGERPLGWQRQHQHMAEPDRVRRHSLKEASMDLRGLQFSADDFEQLLQFIQQRKLSYQPFLFDEEHEVGEGLAILNATSAGPRQGVVNWPHPPSDIADRVVGPSDHESFRSANNALRAIYDYFVASLCRELGEDISGLDFAEFGCNTGYFPYSLSLRGARRTFGLDFTYNKAIFDFFNRKLGTNATFLFSEWDSFRHQPHYHPVPEVDVCLSIAVLCHLADPLHHLTYLCSRARKAVFVWTPSHASDDLYMDFGAPSHFGNSMAWPVSFDYDVKPSRGLLELCLRESGFEDIRHLDGIPTAFDEIGLWKHHSGIIAFRTRSAATVYTGGALRRDLPPDVPPREGQSATPQPEYQASPRQAVERPVPVATGPGTAGASAQTTSSLRPLLVRESDGYNIVRAGDQWYAIPLGVQADLDRQEPASIPGLLTADSEEAILQLAAARPAPPVPHLANTIGDFNIVLYTDRWYAVPFGLSVDWANDDLEQLPGVLHAATQDQAEAAVAASVTQPTR